MAHETVRSATFCPHCPTLAKSLRQLIRLLREGLVSEDQKVVHVAAAVSLVKPLVAAAEAALKAARE